VEHQSADFEMGNHTGLGVDTEGTLEQMVDVGGDFVIQPGICVLEHDVSWDMLQQMLLSRVLSYSLVNNQE